MTRFRALIATNLVLAIVAFALIVPEWRSDDSATNISGLKISAMNLAQLRAALERTPEQPLLITPRTITVTPAIVTSRTTTVTPAPVTPAKRPKPPIAGPDLMTGKQVTLSQFHGKPVFVSVWGSWNAGSIAQASTIARFARSHEHQVAYLGIDSEDSQRAGLAFSKRFHADFPTIWDPIGRFGAWAPVPTTLVFDRRHVLVQKIEGSASLAQLNAALRRVMRH